MKTPMLLAGILTLFLVGCGDNPGAASPATNSAGGNPLNAPGDYLNAITKGQQRAVKTVDTAALNQAVQMFQVDKGRFPKDLNELVAEKFIPKIPEAPAGMKIVYDAAAGTVKVLKE